METCSGAPLEAATFVLRVLHKGKHLLEFLNGLGTCVGFYKSNYLVESHGTSISGVNLRNALACGDTSPVN